MTVPDYRHVPQKLYATGLYDLRSEVGQGAFTDAVVSTLNGIDPNFRHLKKKRGQSQLHGHGEDSVLYLLPDDKAQAVDFIGGAGGSNPQPGWIVDEPRYTHADAHAPEDHGLDHVPAPPPPPAHVMPSYEALGGDAGGQQITRILESDYKRAGLRGLDGECGAWQQRVAYDFLSGICKTVDESIAKHRKEWCDSLGIDVL